MTQPRTNDGPAVPKVKAWIPGFDLIADGGLPVERSTLITGTAGSGKTIFVTQFLAEGIKQAGDAGVFVTFEDAPEDIRRNVLGFGWDIASWERDGKWAFVDGTPQAAAPIPVVGSFDLGALLSRIEHAVKQVGAKRIALDSMNALSLQIEDRALLRARLRARSRYPRAHHRSSGNAHRWDLPRRHGDSFRKPVHPSRFERRRHRLGCGRRREAYGRLYRGGTAELVRYLA